MYSLAKSVSKFTKNFPNVNDPRPLTCTDLGSKYQFRYFFSMHTEVIQHDTHTVNPILGNLCNIFDT